MRYSWPVKIRHDSTLTARLEALDQAERDLVAGFIPDDLVEAIMSGQTDVNYLAHLWAIELCEAWHVSGKSVTIRLACAYLSRQSRLIEQLIDQITTLRAQAHTVTRPRP